MQICSALGGVDTVIGKLFKAAVVDVKTSTTAAIMATLQSKDLIGRIGKISVLHAFLNNFVPSFETTT